MPQEREPADDPDRAADEELRRHDEAPNRRSGPDEDRTREVTSPDPDSPGATIDSDEPAEPNEPA